MNASLPVPVMTAASSAAAAALSENSSPEQSDSGVLMDFRALLQEAGGGAGGTPATNTGDGVETALSPQPLQDGGKLLPLLRQLLDGAAARGLDPQAVLDRLEARLQTLDNETDLDPSALIAVALQQVLDEMPPASPGGTLRQATAADVVAVADTSGNARTLKQLAGDMESGADARQGDRNSPVTEGSRPPLPDKPSVETPLAMAGQRPAEVADLLASLRRLAGGAKTPALDGTQSKTDTAGMQMPQHLPAPAANPSSTPSLLSVAVPVQQAGWDEALGERVQWMLGQRISGAQVRLNPANLGPMEIRIQVQNDQATVHFVSGHAMVREALDAALPRLRDMLEASGVQLVDVDISGESSAGGQGRAAAGEAPFAALPGATEYATPDAVLETAVTTLMERGRLDLFA